MVILTSKLTSDGKLRGVSLTAEAMQDCFLRTQYFHVSLQIVPFRSSNVKQNILEEQSLKKENRKCKCLELWACLCGPVQGVI